MCHCKPDQNRQSSVGFDTCKTIILFIQIESHFLHFDTLTKRANILNKIIKYFVPYKLLAMNSGRKMRSNNRDEP